MVRRIIERLEVAAVNFVAAPGVHSVVRHAALAAVGVVVAADVGSGLTAATAGVAAAAAGRVVLQAVAAALADPEA